MPDSSPLTDRSQNQSQAIWRAGFVLGALYFVSGGVALAYEISWNRQIGLLFGHSEQAAAVVLGAYFVGLGLGYYLGGLLSRGARPLWGYGLAELLAAGWTVLIPRLLEWTESSAVITWLSHPSPAVQTISRGAFCFILLLPATLALGATFPLIAESLRGWTKDIANWSAVCYGLNTLGACVGIAVTTFFLLLRAGVTGSSDLAALCGSCIGVVALFLSRIWQRSQQNTSGFKTRLGGWGRSAAEPSDTSTSGGSLRSTPATQRVVSPLSDTEQPIPAGIWAVALFSGLGTLALEVLYTRLFSLIFHNSSYTFGEIITSFLLALGLAAILVPLLCRLLVPRTLLISAAWLGSVATSVSVTLFIRKTGLEYFPLAQDFQTYLLNSFSLTLLVVFPPILCLGMLLPSLWKSLKVEQLSGSVLGRITMLNSIAAALGAMFASFVLLPSLGLWRAFAVVSFGFLILSCSLPAAQRKWGAALLMFVVGLVPTLVVWSGNELWVQQHSSDEEVLKRWETAYGWIDVIRDTSSNSLKIRQNLHYRHGSTGNNETRERRQALLPLLLHDKPESVLHLGLGTGITAAGTLEDPDVKEITIVELIPEVVEAARMLGQSNNRVLEDPRVTVRVDDARHFLLATDQTFDVIVSDLFVPWESQTGYLYTVEHFQTAKSRLREGGLYCQWLPLYQVGPSEFEMIANSFASVFPDTTLWWGLLSRSKPMIALVGAEAPLLVSREELSRRIGRISAHTDLHDSYLSRPDRVLELALGRWPHHKDAVLNTDEHPRVEFLTPLSHLDRRLMNRDRLKDYFDRVLDKLPPALEGMSIEEQQRSRDAQRVILFPK